MTRRSSAGSSGDSGRWSERLRNGLRCAGGCVVLLAGFGLMLRGDRLLARAAGLPSGDALLAVTAVTGDAAGTHRALAGGAGTGTRSEAGYPALVAAAGSGNVTMVRELLAWGADPNAMTERGWTALGMAAVMSDDPEMVLALLAGGADPAVGRSPLLIAADEGHERVVAVLRGARADSAGGAEEGRSTRDGAPSSRWLTSSRSVRPSVPAARDRDETSRHGPAASVRRYRPARSPDNPSYTEGCHAFHLSAQPSGRHPRRRIRPAPH